MSNTQQPFLGTIVATAAGTALVSGATRAVEGLVDRVLRGNGAEPAAAAKAAAEVAPRAAAEVVEELKKDPVIRTAINGEPLSKSVAFLLGLGGTLSAIGGLLTLYFNGQPDPLEAYVALAGTLATSIGAMIRRAQFTPSV